MHPPVLLFQLDLVLNSEEGGDLSDFITNGEWYLLGKSVFLSFSLLVAPRRDTDNDEKEMQLTRLFLALSIIIIIVRATTISVQR